MKKSYRHFQFAEDGITVVGISELAAVMLYFPKSEDNEHINFGWRFIDGEWHPPLPPPEPTEEDCLLRELDEIDSRLRQLYDAERFAVWKGETVTEPLPELNIKEHLLTRSKAIQEQLTKLHKKHKSPKGDGKR
jgi:hypothetical protein